MSNIKKYCIYTTLYNLGFTFCTGAIMQTFLIQAGFSAELVYVLNSLMQIMQVAMMLQEMQNVELRNAAMEQVKILAGLDGMRN